MSTKMKQRKREKMPAMEQYLCKLYSTRNHPSTAPLILDLDGKIKRKQLVNLCNQNWLKYNRLRSIVNEKEMYFEEIPSFNCDTNVKEKIFNDNISPTTDFVVSYYSNNLYDIKMDPLLPRWYLYVLQFKNKTTLLFIAHHCIGDGNTVLELLKSLCRIKSNLTNNTKLYNKSSKIWRLFKYYPITPFLRTFGISFKYEYNKRIRWNKINILEPADGLKGEAAFSMIELNDKLISQKRKLMIENGQWIKHSFNNFVLCVLSETLTYFMKYTMNLKNHQIPDDILIATPVNLRPFYDNWEHETVIGNLVSSYLVYIPLNPKLTFAERLKIIKQNQDYCMNSNEQHGMANLLWFESKLPRNAFVSLLNWAGRICPITFSGVKEYDTTNWNILGKEVNKCFTFLPRPPSSPLGFAYIMLPNRKLCISATMDNAICGENGTKLLMNTMRFVLKKYNCIPNDRAML